MLDLAKPWRGPIADRFLARTRPDGDCVLWNGSMKGNTGLFCVDSKMVSARRWSFENVHGAVRRDARVTVTCDAESCVNPAHLALSMAGATKMGRPVTRREKKCTRCKAVRPASDFHSDTSRPDGMAYVCVECRDATRERNPRQWPKRSDVFGSSYQVDASGCWLWTKGMGTNGYGHFWDAEKRRTVVAHRVSWETHNGPIRGDLLVCHKCDVRNCVNPAHLFLGTTRDNIDDCVAKGRNCKGDRHPTHLHPERVRGSNNGRAILDEDTVRRLRAAWEASDKRKGEQMRIAREFGVSHAVATQAIHRKTWRHVA